MRSYASAFSGVEQPIHNRQIMRGRISGFTSDVLDGRRGNGDAEPVDAEPTLDTDGLHATMPLSALVGIRVASAAAAEVRLELDWREDLCTAAGVLHGGALMSLADTAGGLCAFLNLPDGATGT